MDNLTQNIANLREWGDNVAVNAIHHAPSASLYGTFLHHYKYYTGSEEIDASFLFLCAILTSVLTAFAWRFLDDRNYKLFGSGSKYRYPPTPQPCLWFLGNALSLLDSRRGKHPDPKFLEWAKEYGTVYSIRLPMRSRMIIVGDPSLIKQITVSKNYDKSWTYAKYSQMLGSKSIATVHGHEWQSKRRLFNPAFSPSFLKSEKIMTIFCDKLNRFTALIDQDIAQNEVTNTLKTALSFTGDVLAGSSFGEDWGGKTTHPAVEWFGELANTLFRLGNDPVAAHLGFGLKRKAKDLETKLDNEMGSLVDRRLKEQQEDKVFQKDLCSIAVAQLTQEDGTLTAEDRTIIIHQAKTFYFAGNDTTAILMSWCTWLLSQHPEMLKKLREEIESKDFWKSGNDAPTYEQVMDCPYLEACLKETLRLYPPGATVRYTPDATETWKDYYIGKSVLYVCPYILHRMPEHWENPDDFKPERFYNVSASEYNDKFIPFSRGRRDCIGKYFAMLEAKVALSALIMKYDLECFAPQDEPIGYHFSSYPLHGARVKFSPRKSKA